MYRFTITVYEQKDRNHYHAEFEQERSGKTQRLAVVEVSRPCSKSADPSTHEEMLSELGSYLPLFVQMLSARLPAQELPF